MMALPPVLINDELGQWVTALAKKNVKKNAENQILPGIVVRHFYKMQY